MLDLLIKYEKVDTLDIQFTTLIEPNTEHPIFYLILLLSRAVRLQHSCLPLSMIDIDDPFCLNYTDHQRKETVFDSLTHIQTLLQHHDAVGQEKPLTLYQGHLYLSRFDAYERNFVQAVTLRNQQNTEIDLNQVSALLEHYFPDEQGPNWQKVACAAACLKRFSIISGGPGTGKTTTVTKLLAILQSLYASVPLKVKLVAPTGKAAARLSESIVSAKQYLQIDTQIAKHIPETAFTLHRLLGVIYLSNQFRHNKHNLLDVDLLVLDEASMVDLSMLAKLFEALPTHTRVIMLGDKDQLSSVDAGNVMADLCAPLTFGRDHTYSAQFAKQLAELCNMPLGVNNNTQYQLNDNLSFLQFSHRFQATSGIGQLAKAVNNNDINALNQIRNSSLSDLTFTAIESQFKSFIDYATNQYSHFINLAKQGAAYHEVHKAFASFQILSSTRLGPFGVNNLNRLVEKQLLNDGHIINTGHYYVGMPLMISENNYQLNLFNGDIGILILDGKNRLMSSFIDENGEQRLISTTRLPAFEKVYAMTIHKSQGSEFDEVAMVLGQSTGTVNKQLVYTGITRAKSRFQLVAVKGALEYAMSRNVARYSGLFQRFQNTIQ